MKPWFAPKSYGYGAGLPVAWQGWLVLTAYVGGALAAALLLRGPFRWGVLAALTAGVIAVSAATTEGGWRWRWGSDR